MTLKLNLTFFFVVFCVSAFKPKGEWAYVQDDMHKEVRETGEDLEVHQFEDFNYTKIEEQIFLKAFKKRFDGLVAKYDDKLADILADESLDSKTVGPHLIDLFGENYSKMKYEIKDMQIDMKSFIEKQLDIFFLYKCQNKYFKITHLFRKCGFISKTLKKQLMFDNFFDFGYQNMVLDILREYKIDEEFNEALDTQLNGIKGIYKIMDNILMFIDELYTEKTTRRIISKYGKGIDVNIHVHKDQ